MLLRNTEKLQNLIDQLLELSQLEAETIPLNKQPQELVSLLKGFTYSFMPLAEQKFVTLNFSSSEDKLPALIDRDKLEKIINNLLSNAFKFTPVGGKIAVEIKFEANYPGVSKPVVFSTEAAKDIERLLNLKKAGLSYCHFVFLDEDGTHYRNFNKYTPMPVTWHPLNQNKLSNLLHLCF